MVSPNFADTSRISRRELKVYFSARDGDQIKLIIIQSVGTYRSGISSFEVNFENSVENIISNLFLELLNLFQDQHKEETIIHFDVSTGRNFYISAAMEALRAFIVHEKLRYLIHGNDFPIRAQLTFTPPVFGEKITPVGFGEYDVKAFFELPLKRSHGSTESMQNI